MNYVKRLTNQNKSDADKEQLVTENKNRNILKTTMAKAITEVETKLKMDEIINLI